MSQQRVWVWRGSAPLWLTLAAAVPVVVLFLASFVLAGALLVGGGLLASALLPLFRKRRPTPQDGTIELDRSDYKRLQ